MAKDKFGLQNKLSALLKAKRDMPVIIGNMAVKHFQQSFRAGGFTDDVFQPWQPRKGELQRRGPAMVRSRGRFGQSSRAVLVRSGDLRRSVRIKSARFSRIVIGSDLDYAAIHNYGLEGKAWGRHRFKMPKRQFIGNSAVLNRQIMKRIEREVNKIFK